MSSYSELCRLTIQQLAPLARDCGVTRLHSLRKSELIERLAVRLDERCVLERISVSELIRRSVLEARENALRAKQAAQEAKDANVSNADEASDVSEISKESTSSEPFESSGSSQVEKVDSAGSVPSVAEVPRLPKVVPAPRVPNLSQSIPSIPSIPSMPSSSRTRSGKKKKHGSARKTIFGGVLEDVKEDDMTEEEIREVIPHVEVEKNPQVLSSFAQALKNFEAQPQSKHLYTTRSNPKDLSYLPDMVDDKSDIDEESLDLEMIDPYWLHVTWCIRRRSIERAKAAMGKFWYDAKPTLRVTVLNSGDAGTGGRFQHDRDIEIHGHVNHWFISVPNPPAKYLVEVGYLAKTRFFSLIKSNVVSTPQVRSALRYEKSTEVSWMTACGLQPAQTPSWSPTSQSLYKKWTEKAKKPLADGTSVMKIEVPEIAREEYPLRIETEMVLYGSTSPDSQVTIDSEWVAVQPDGTFMLRIAVPENGCELHTVNAVDWKESKKVVFSIQRETQQFAPEPVEKEE